MRYEYMPYIIWGSRIVGFTLGFWVALEVRNRLGDL